MAACLKKVTTRTWAALKNTTNDLGNEPDEGSM